MDRAKAPGFGKMLLIVALGLCYVPAFDILFVRSENHDEIIIIIKSSLQATYF